jgi:hypothetical protein
MEVPKKWKAKQRQKRNLKAEFEAIVRPKPNSSFLGFRPKLFIYKIAGTPKKARKRIG